MKYIADISSYQPDFDFKKFQSYGGIGVIIKTSMQLGFDSKYLTFAEKIRETDLLFGVYHWIDAIPANPQKQVDLFSQAIEKVNPDFLCGDNEQWWADWNKYMAAINKKIPMSEVPRLNSKKINDFSQEWFEKISQRHQKKLYQYTGRWFIDGYCPQMKTWLNRYPLWLAEYRKIPKMRSLDFTGIELKPPSGVDWEIWQFSSSMYLPGVNLSYGIERPFDINMVRDDFSVSVSPKKVNLQKDLLKVKILSKADRGSEQINIAEETVTICGKEGDYYKVYPEGYIHKNNIEGV